jgi:hypothetical protein
MYITHPLLVLLSSISPWLRNAFKIKVAFDADEYLLKIGLRDAEATSTSASQSPIFNRSLNRMVNSSRSSCSAMRQTLVEPRAMVSCSESHSINRHKEHS